MQWELENKKSDDLDLLKVDRNYWAKTMEAIVLHLRLIREMRAVPLAYVVRQHIKIVHICPG